MDPAIIASPQFGIIWRKKLLGNYNGWTEQISPIASLYQYWGDSSWAVCGRSCEHAVHRRASADRLVVALSGAALGEDCGGGRDDRAGARQPLHGHAAHRRRGGCGGGPEARDDGRDRSWTGGHRTGRRIRHARPVGELVATA